MLEEPGSRLGSAVMVGQTSKEAQLVRGAEEPSHEGGPEVALAASVMGVQIPAARVSWLETVVPLCHAGSWTLRAWQEVVPTGISQGRHIRCWIWSHSSPRMTIRSCFPPLVPTVPVPPVPPAQAPLAHVSSHAHSIASGNP